LSSSTAPDESPPWLSDLRRRAAELGFVKIGIAPAIDSSGFTELVRWIEDGYAAEMRYFAERLDAYRHPDGVMPGTKSIIVMAYPYPSDRSADVPVGSGRVARYAWSGVDYHDVVHRHLKQLKGLIVDSAPETRVRGCVDTAPLMERELAQLAGLGWRGKNTLLLNREIGSYFFLACLLVDVELPLDAPHETSHCGSCTACLDACPTDAFPAPGVLDAGRCISYLTIEHRDAVPVDLRDGIGDWAFGCDVCQEVCPWNRKPTRRAAAQGSEMPYQQINLRELFGIDDEAFRATFRKSPFWRTRLRGIRRNAAIVLGNQGDPSALPALRRGAAFDDEMVAETCRWAIHKIMDGDG
jgi:epoxyqueuosine reductase